MSKSLQICYFPYLFLNKEKAIDFGEISVWNFKLLSSTRIENDELRKHISRLLASNIRNGKPIEDIGIISFRGIEEFSPLTAKEQSRVDDFRKLLFFTKCQFLAFHCFL